LSSHGGGAIDSKPEKNPDVAYRALGSEEGAVLLHLQSGEYHGVNELGLVVWELIDGERTVGEIIETVREQTDDAPPRLADDVVAFLDSMRQLDLVVD
jgi:Coenzyme PQQ synthesis protein D (PqqD)